MLSPHPAASNKQHADSSSSSSSRCAVQSQEGRPAVELLDLPEQVLGHITSWLEDPHCFFRACHATAAFRSSLPHFAAWALNMAGQELVLGHLCQNKHFAHALGQQQQLSVVRVLLSSGASTAAYSGTSLLVFAAAHGHVPLLELLLARLGHAAAAVDAGPPCQPAEGLVDVWSRSSEASALTLAHTFLESHLLNE